MQEVRPHDLEVGKHYYIQLVGRYAANQHRESGKAVGKRFKRMITFHDITREYGWDGINVGIHPETFNNNDIFVQFNEVVSVSEFFGNNEDNIKVSGRPCGICDFEFHYLYPATMDNFNELTEEQKAEDRGGYQFFEMKRKELKKRLTEQALNKDRPGIEAQPGIDEGTGVKSVIAELIGPQGGKKQRKRRRKSRRKSRRRKSRRKNKRTRKRRRRRRRK